MKTLLLVISCFFPIFAISSVKNVEDCTLKLCKLEDNCRCASPISPVTDENNPGPQLIAITFSEPLTQLTYDNYLKPLFFDRKNPDGSPTGLTFYVSHEFTDYALVHDLYLRGYEIGDYSITKNSNLTYWQTASLKDLEDEFLGQKTIISTFANIPAADIIGVRTPFFQMNGDLAVTAYQASGLTYDNSWSTLQRLFPYTLTYASVQDCTTIPECPNEGHPKFWVAPINTIIGSDSKECGFFSYCRTQETAITNWLYNQVSKVYMDNRAPITLTLDSKWFATVENSFEQFARFLDGAVQVEDIFFVTVQDILTWTQNPLSAKDYRVPDHSGRTGDCLDLLCPLQDDKGQMQYMKSCVSCPEVYPWIGNPKGEAKENV